MASFSKGTSFTDGVTGDVTAAKLHALVDAATPVGGLVTDRTAKTSVVGADLVLISDSADSNNLKKVTVTNFSNNIPSVNLTTGTIAAATLGTTTGTLATFTAATITTGTIPTATLGTTTGTLATFTGATITTGTIPTATLGTTTGTAATFTTGTLSTGVIPTGTFGTTTSTAATITNGTVTTLNSTTGTITNLSTTLAGDFTISAGTGTLGTTGVTAGTYGTSTAAVTLTLDAKGRVTTVSTSAISTTPADGSITFAKLSTSATESDNVAKRTAKAWVNFNGTGVVAIRDDFNVSTVGDDGTGQYTINFSTAMPNANYAVVVTSKRGDGNQTNDPSLGAISPSTAYSSSIATGFCKITCKVSATVPQDPDAAMVIVFSS